MRESVRIDGCKRKAADWRERLKLIGCRESRRQVLAKEGIHGLLQLRIVLLKVRLLRRRICQTKLNAAKLNARLAAQHVGIEPLDRAILQTQ